MPGKQLEYIHESVLLVKKNLTFVSTILTDRCKIPSDGVPISSSTLARDLGGITIWNP